MLRINNVKVKIGNTNYTEIISNILNISKKEILDVKLIKQSIDARRSQVVYNCSFAFEVKDESKIHHKSVTTYTPYQYIFPSSNNLSVTIVGSGPAGLFCAYVLSNAGNKVTIIERGKKVEERIKDVEKLFNEGILNSSSNIAYGEGGAGTFSDGKLQTGVKNKRLEEILKAFVKYGAPEDILYKAKPHIGTDYLRKVIVNMRKDLESKGVTFIFNSCMTDFSYSDHYEIEINHTDTIQSDVLVLAIGHSARDTYRMLYRKGIPMSQKPFAMGVRIEQHQSEINEIQYGKQYANKLEAASYKLAVHTEENRSVFTFCMCPGGTVVPSMHEDGTICINGMSEHARDKENANSAILVNILPSDFPSSHPLSGLDFQEELEKKAYQLTGSLKAPVQRVVDYIDNVATTELKDVLPSYPLGYELCNLNDIFPEFMNRNLKLGLQLMNKKMLSFYNESTILTGIEGRSSSPVRIERNENFQSFPHLYPIGEGAGYAGGIMSAALDGMLCAEKILED